MREKGMRAKRDWSRLVPPGKDWYSQRNWLLGGLWVSAIWAALAFATGYFEELSRLELIARRYPEEMANFTMPDFDSFLPGSLWPFLVVVAGALPQIYVNYYYHRQGSRSDYLMRRLPDKWEWHRRCLAVPVLAIIGAVTLAAALLVAFFLLYQFYTPYEWLLCSREGAPERSCGRVYRLLYGIFCQGR